MNSLFIKITLLLFLLLALLAVSGCMSPQEKNGVSLLPRNRPSTWESNRSMNNRGMF